MLDWLDWKYLLLALWSWIVAHGLTLAALIVIGVLIPRVGRLVVRIITERMTRGEEQTKSHLAFIGALVYLLEIVAYFFLVYSALTNLGVSTVGAAVPATVVSAAIGFGAQKVIGDFLAGFFIISEHQYGVGDFVSFDSTSDQVKGTVVRLTLRSTQIRTGNGELITVPNSSASVTINYSQEWSRAVVDLELPMTVDDTMTSLADTVSVVTQRAIDTAGVREEILGDVSVLPAMNITAPTAAGLPWTVGIQVTVDVNPATQWKVQRTIRAALINEFWDRFQAPGDRPTAYSGPPTQAFPPVTPPSEDTGTADAADAVEAGEPRPSDADTVSTGRHAAADDTATTVFGAATEDADGTDGGTEDGQDADGKKTDDSANGTDMDQVAADVAANGIWRNLDTGSRITRVISLGGRIRPSSGMLVIVIVLLAVIGLLSTNPSGGRSSVLSPARWAPATTTAAPETQTPTDTPETQTPETEETPSGTPAPTETPESDTPTSDTPDLGDLLPWNTGGQSGSSSPTTPSDQSDGAGTQTREPNPLSRLGGGTGDNGDSTATTGAR